MQGNSDGIHVACASLFRAEQHLFNYVIGIDMLLVFVGMSRWGRVVGEVAQS